MDNRREKVADVKRSLRLLADLKSITSNIKKDEGGRRSIEPLDLGEYSAHVAYSSIA